MDISTLEFAKLADRAGLIYANSLLLISKNHKLNDVFQQKVNEVTLLHRFDELNNVDCDERFDKTIVVGANYYDYEFFQNVRKLSYLTASSLMPPVIYVHQIRLQSKWKLEDLSHDANLDKEWYKWKRCDIWREKWEEEHNILIQL